MQRLRDCMYVRGMPWNRRICFLEEANDASLSWERPPWRLHRLAGAVQSAESARN